ncbi:MAG: hypothetical protein JWN78_2257 [Bacteroidota bacterium]|nr:hypothetical protein [Bacteroidota bacterium]
MRIFVTILAVFISTITFAQSGTFEKRVEQLFFNKDVSSMSVAIIDTLASVKEISYIKPAATSSYFMPTGILSVWTHTFNFTNSPYMPIPFDKGLILIHARGTNERLKDITLELLYEQKETAVKAYNDLVKFLTVDGFAPRMYRQRISIFSAEMTNNGSKKYPNIMFHLFNNKNADKKYKIRLFVE